MSRTLQSILVEISKTSEDMLNSSQMSLLLLAQT